MPAIAPIVINDATTPTPVAHTFAPVTTNGSQSKYADRAASLPAGYLKLEHEITPPSGARTTYQLNVGYQFPVVKPIDGVDTVVRYSAGKLTLNFDPSSTAQERDDALTLLTGFLNNATVKTSVKNLEPFY